MSATPRPWAAKGRRVRSVDESGGFRVAEFRDADDAALTVRAVNSHDALASSLKELLHYARNCGADSAMLDRASDALAAAEGISA